MKLIVFVSVSDSYLLRIKLGLSHTQIGKGFNWNFLTSIPALFIWVSPLGYLSPCGIWDHSIYYRFIPRDIKNQSNGQNDSIFHKGKNRQTWDKYVEQRCLISLFQWLIVRMIIFHTKSLIYIFHPIWHYNDHANGCNKSQHCCVLLRVFGQQCCVWVRLQGPKSLTGFKLYATSANIVVVPCKRMQHVGPNNVACCWPTMLRPFAWAFTYQKSTD